MEKILKNLKERTALAKQKKEIAIDARVQEIFDEVIGKCFIVADAGGDYFSLPWEAMGISETFHEYHGQPSALKNKLNQKFIEEGLEVNIKDKEITVQWGITLNLP